MTTASLELEATTAIAAHVAQLSLADVPDVVRERAKLAILDTVGVALAGSRQPALDLVTGLAAEGIESGSSAVLGRKRRVPAATAAFVNGCAAHVLDFDDSGHSSAHMVPTVLAVGDELDRSGADVLTGYVAGREVRMHLNEAIDAGRFDFHSRGPGSRGWHATGTLGALGSAAGAARVIGLDERQTATAIGIAASFAAGIISNFGTMTKCLHVGNAARSGVTAALLASRGFTADATVLTSTKGFVEAMCGDLDIDLGEVVEKLSSTFLLDVDGNRIKPFPSCTATHRTIAAVRRLVDDHGVSPDDVLSASCTAQPALVCPAPTNALEAKFSAPFAIAATLIDGGITLDNCTDEFLASDRVQALLAVTSEVPQEAEGWVRIVTKDGRELQQSIWLPPGLATVDEVVGKFRQCAEPVIGAASATKVVELTQRIDELESVRELTALL